MLLGELVLVVYMKVIVGKAMKLFGPEGELVVLEVGGVFIVRKLNYLKILEKLGGWFVDLSEEGKEKIALEAKKWARREWFLDTSVLIVRSNNVNMGSKS